MRTSYSQWELCHWAIRLWVNDSPPITQLEQSPTNHFPAGLYFLWSLGDGGTTFYCQDENISSSGLLEISIVGVNILSDKLSILCNRLVRMPLVARQCQVIRAVGTQLLLKMMPIGVLAQHTSGEAWRKLWALLISDCTGRRKLFYPIRKINLGECQLVQCEVVRRGVCLNPVSIKGFLTHIWYLVSAGNSKHIWSNLPISWNWLCQLEWLFLPDQSHS